MNIGDEFTLPHSDTLYVVVNIRSSYGNSLLYEYCPKHLVDKPHSVGFFSLPNKADSDE